MIFQIGENIPFTVVLLKNNGTRDTGKSPDVTLVSNDTGAEILTDQIMTETILNTSGIYRYLWTNTLTVNTTLTYFIKNAGTVVSSGTIRVVNVLEQIMNNIDTGESSLS